MRQFSLILLTAVFSCCLLAQQPENQNVSHGRIIFNDARVIEAQPIVISKDSVEYYLKNSDTKSAFELYRVQKIQRYNGNYSRTGMWIGFVIGTGVGVAVAANTTHTEQTGYNEQTTTVQLWPIYLFSAVGGALGYLIGMSTDDWQTVYVNPRLPRGLAGTERMKGEVRISYAVHF